MFDLDFEDAVTDPVLCPEAVGTGVSCIVTRTFQVELGPIAFVAVPGELLPEIARGFPDDAAWAVEAVDPVARGPESTYFPQHDADCDLIPFEQCRDAEVVGDCDCLAIHAWPYTIGPDPSMPPLLDLVEGRYEAVIGMADDYLSYIVPEPDFNTRVTLLSDRDGDHYEDTVSPAHNFATRIQEAQRVLSER
jgi:hypothetical protein